ncbi:MAG: hypothetical protein EHM45_22725 [Desulfobacteraceae bacterium]|nr:MAG: hypothetical protein EHM45_22725 [Desulfobacteraceae bacterium]
MGLKEKMMEGMIGNMSAEEKQEMMDAMMEKFFSTLSAEDKQKMMGSMMEKFMGSMSADEKQGLMSNMMPKMMGQMMGGGPQSMMGMMASMMGRKTAGENKGEETSEMPFDMCRKMMGSIGRSSELASYATPELRGLFEEWLSQIEEEIKGDIEKAGSADPAELAQKYKLGKESIHFILGKLAQKDKINIKAEKK